MRTKLKIGLALVVSLTVFSVFVFAQPPALASDDPQLFNGDHAFPVRETDERHPMERAFRLEADHSPRERFLRELLSGHTEPVGVAGIFQGFARNLMVLDTDDGIISVVLPPAWAVNGQIVRLHGLLEMGALNVGDFVEVETLRKTIVGGADAGYTVYVLFGYSIYDVDTETGMEAILPFNIEVAG